FLGQRHIFEPHSSYRCDGPEQTPVHVLVATTFTPHMPQVSGQTEGQTSFHSLHCAPTATIIRAAMIWACMLL
ncbi:hypothetical protein PFISCL1PPCAC_1071, partial [Pristionchus fissidentatus]